MGGERDATAAARGATPARDGPAARPRPAGKERRARRPSLKVQANLPPVLAWQLRIAAATEGVRPCVLMERALRELLKSYQYPPVPPTIRALTRGDAPGESAA